MTMITLSDAGSHGQRWQWHLQHAMVSAWTGIYQHLASDTSLSEVILNGGDPLIPGDRQLSDIITKLDSIETIDTIRLHTRLPR